ncbi:MAG: hypothetical protein DRJ03_24960 [Chloroflexi bacterium]|nr:MAG: hypothetical protein DRJ03_24960 [Chloroflexota bacterium]
MSKKEKKEALEAPELDYDALLDEVERLMLIFKYMRMAKKSKCNCEVCKELRKEFETFLQMYQFSVKK